MSNWFFGKRKDGLVGWIERLRNEIVKHLGETLKMPDEDILWEQLQRLVQDERTEKFDENQLMRAFAGEQPELMEKDKNLTPQLRQDILQIGTKLEDIFYHLAELEEAVKANDSKKIRVIKKELAQMLRALIKSLDDAKEIAEYIIEMEEIENVKCSAYFKKKLKKSFKKHLKEVQKYLSRVGDKGWREGNSEKLSGFAYYSFPKRKGNIRMIFKTDGTDVIVLDIWTHDDYERKFSQSQGTLPNYGGLKDAEQVFKPLNRFALSN